MDSDLGKLFIGGISWETSEEVLKEYFGNYGEVLQTVVMRDKETGRPRGFGFVVFADPAVLDRVLQDKHVIDSRTVEAKRALSREEQQVQRSTNPYPAARSAGPGGSMRTKKIFVGGLPPTITEEGFRQYFEEFGNVTDVVVMYDQSTQRPRGFGFISFDTEEAVDKVLLKTFHDLNGKQVEVKRALPKDANPGGGGRSSGGGSGGGDGGYPSYGGSGGIQSSYDSRGDSNRYMQAQGAGGGFPSYGSTGGGYGPGSNGMAYGGYAGYGPATAAAYGNPYVPNAGYGGGARSTWGTQAPSGYGAVGYGGAAGGASSGGPGAAPTSQSLSGAAGYGNQGGYQYSCYGGTDGSYGYAGGYGAVAGRGGNTPNAGGASGGDLSGSGGYMGGGYGDANGNSGYGNAYGSQANGPQGAGQGGYGGGYQARQAQQQ